MYRWLPEQVLGKFIRGRLFATCFAFANGPIMMWRNSLVPHCNNKMTSLIIHVSPSLTLFGLRRNADIGQKRKVVQARYLYKMASIGPTLTSYKNLIKVLLSLAHGGSWLSLVISWALLYIKDEARPGSHTYHFAGDRYLCSRDTP